MIVAAHGKSQREFEGALAAALRASGLTPRTAVIAAGGAVYPLRLTSQEDGPHAVLPGVGFIRLTQDPTLEPWSAAIVEVEEA